MSRWRLARESIRYDAGVYARLAVLAAVIGFVIVALQVFSATTTDTLRQDTYARALWQEVVVTPPPDATKAADLLARFPEIFRVSSFTESIGTDESLVPDVSIAGVESAVARAPSWASGLLPRSVGQVAVSATVAESLQVAAGDQVWIGGTSYAVSGVLPTLADRHELSAVAFVDPTALPEGTVPIWYMSRLTADASIGETDTGIELRSVADHLIDSPFRSNARRAASTIDGAALPGALAAGAALFGAAIALLASRRRDVGALVAIGMSRTKARSVFAWAAAAVMTAAVCVGAVVAWLVMSITKSWVSALVGQTWLGVVVPVPSLPRSLLVMAGVCGVGLAVAVRRPAPLPLAVISTSRDGAKQAAATITLISALAYVGWLAVNRRAPGPVAVLIATGLAVIVGLSLPVVVGWIVRPTGQGVRRLLATAGPATLSAFTIAPIVLIITLCVSAEMYSEYQQGISSSQIPERGLQLESVRPDDAAALSAAYRRLTGYEALVSVYPSEADPHTMFRVAGGASAGCWRSASTLDACPDSEMTLIGIPVSGYGPSDTWRVAPYLDDGSGQVTVIELDPSDDTIRDVKVYDAMVDGSVVGTYANGAVVPTGSSLYEPDAVGPVLLPRFDDLDLVTQAKVRRAVFNHAGYSLAVVSEVADYGFLALTWAVAMFGLVVTGSLVVWWAVALWRGDPSVNWFVVSLPNAASVARRLVLWCIAPVAVVLSLSGVVAIAIGNTVLQLPIGSFAPFVGPTIAVLVVTLVISWLSLSSALRSRDRTLGG